MGEYIGTDGNDFLGPTTRFTVDLFDGRGGDDRITTDYGLDTALGGAGDDYVDTTRGNQQLKVGYYGRGDWREFDFLPSSELVDGGSGNDYVASSAGTDTLIGGEGFDVVSFGNRTFWSDGTLYGEYWKVSGLGAEWDSSTGAVINLARGTAIFEGYHYVANLTAEGERYTAVRDGFGAFSHKISGYEAAIGTVGDDTMIGSRGDDVLDGGAGGQDRIDGGAGFDIASFATRFEHVVGDFNAQEDTINLVVDLRKGEATFDVTVRGEIVRAGVSVLRNVEGVYGSKNDDVLLGDSENNLFFGGDGADTIDGGKGFDTLTYYRDAALNRHVSFTPEGFSGVVVNLATGFAVDGFGRTDVISNIEHVIGSHFGDRITGDKFDNLLEGREGDDLLVGGAGDDVIMGGQGVDTLIGGKGKDLLSYAEEDGGQGVIVDLRFRGERSFDTYGTEDVFRYKGDQADFDQVMGSSWGDLITIEGFNTTLSGLGGDDTLVGGYSVSGGTGNDSIIGRSSLSGDEGDDIILGLSDNGDTILGGDGNDTLEAETDTGDDRLLGGDGDDVITSVDGDTSVRPHLEKWLEARLAGTDLDDRFMDILKGEDGNDTIFGVGLLQGGADNDTIRGAGILDGGAGDDVITAERKGTKVDFLDAIVSGGDGHDVLIGRGTQAAELYVSYGYAASGVKLDLLRGTAVVNAGDTDEVRGFRKAYGSDFGDTITGGRGNTEIYGFDGDDVIKAATGKGDWYAIIDGGAGNDRITVTSADWADIRDTGGGKDVVKVTIDGYANAFTGDENDVIQIKAGGSIVADGEDGNDRISVTMSNRSAEPEGFVRVAGGYGDDTITARIDALLTERSGELYYSYVTGGFGDDVITVTQTKRDEVFLEIFGDDGEDRIKVDTYWALVDGGDDADTIEVNLRGDPIVGSHEINGGDGDDVITVRRDGGGTTQTHISGGDGDDTIASYDDNVYVWTGVGDDWVTLDFGTRGNSAIVEFDEGAQTVVVEQKFLSTALRYFDSEEDRLDVSAIASRKSDTFEEIIKTARAYDEGALIKVNGATFYFSGFRVADFDADMFLF